MACASIVLLGEYLLVIFESIVFVIDAIMSFVNAKYNKYFQKNIEIFDEKSEEVMIKILNVEISYYEREYVCYNNKY